MERRNSSGPWIAAAVIVAVGIAIGVGIWAFLRWLRKPLVAVPHVDLRRFSGTWHAIAAMPAADRRAAPGAAMRVVHLGGSLLQIAHLTRGSGGRKRPVRATALSDSTGAVLRLSRGGPLGRDLVVLALSPSYDACVVGSPDRRRAWILSRKSEISRELWRHFRDELARQGFNADKLRQAPGTRVRTDAWGEDAPAAEPEGV